MNYAKELSKMGITNWKLIEFAAANKLGEPTKGNPRDIRTEDFVYVPVEGTTKERLYKVEDVNTVAKMATEEYVELTMSNELDGETLTAKILCSSNCTNIWKFETFNDNIIWYFQYNMYLMPNSEPPTLDTSTICDWVGQDWIVNLNDKMGNYKVGSLIDLQDICGKEFKDTCKKVGIHRLAYRDNTDKCIYTLRDTEDGVIMVACHEENLMEAIEDYRKEQKKVTVEIDGKTYVFASAEEAKAILG